MSTSFGSYEVLGLVASGSTGTVYRCRHAELQRVAAVKELSAEVRAVPGLLERFRGEAAVLSLLDHPHVVAVYDYVEEPERAWIAQQWVDGASLDAILTGHGPLSAEQSLGVLRGALLGLAHAHERGLVHRDIAPGNILADLAGRSMLVDFGLAAPVGGTGAQGTPAFMSPEAALGQPFGTSGDVYSAGAVLFALLSGRPPFPAADAAGVLRRQVQDPAPALTGHGADLASLVARCLDKDPAARPADAGALLVELEEAARRRFGAGWLERASIAGVVASVAAGTVGVVAAGVSTGAAVGAPTVLIDTAVRAAGATAVTAARTGARFSRGALVAAAAAAALVVAGVTVGVASVTGGDGPSADDPASGGRGTTAGRGESASPTPEPTPTPTPPTLSELAPTGVYATKYVIVSTTFPGDTAGDTREGTWTLTPTCTATACTGTIDSSTGNAFTYTWDGTQLVLDPRAPEVTEGLCVNTETGVESPGSHYKDTVTETWSPFVATAPNSAGSLAPPDSLAGTHTVDLVTTELSEACTADNPVANSVNTFTLTRQAAAPLADAATPSASPAAD